MEGEGRRSKEAVRNSIRTYGVKVLDPAALPLRKTKETESQESVSRFSEKPLQEPQKIKRGKYKGLINNLPYASILATIFLFLGLFIAGIAGNRGLTITSNVVRGLLKDNLDIFDFRVSTAKTSLIVFEIFTSIMGLLSLIFGVLTTGVVRGAFYRRLGSSLGGRITCMVLMVLDISVFLLWLTVFWSVSAVAMALGVAENFCAIYGKEDNKLCQKLLMLDIFQPNETIKGIELCSPVDKKKFCKDFVEKTSPLFIMCGVGTFFVMMALMAYISCLSANYVRIGCETKVQELEELHRLGHRRSSYT